MSGEYGEEDRKFLTGERVELHPGCDLWMQGATHGVVRGIKIVNGLRVIAVKMDHPQVKTMKYFPPDRLRRL